MTLMNNAASMYHNLLFTEDGKPYLDYLLNRNVSMEDIKKWQIGFAGNFVKLTKELKCSQEHLLEVNLMKQDPGKPPRNFYWKRIMFPITNTDGNTVSFGARTIEPDVPNKYINGSETSLYIKGQTLYGLHQAAKTIAETGEVFVCEGYLDVIRMHRYGFTSAVASCGTALTMDQANLLASLGAKKIIMMFDGDLPGINASIKATELLLGHPTLSGVSMILKDGNDPDDFLDKYGKEEFKKLLRQEGLRFFDFLKKMRWEEACKNHNSEIPRINAFIERIKPAFNKLSPGEQAYEIPWFVELIDLPEQNVLDALKKEAA